jgi:hypothetical protein
MKGEESDFGKGLAYCLGLFLAHQGELRAGRFGSLEPIRARRLWFYGAADHIHELQIDHAPTEEIKIRLMFFVNKLQKWRLPLESSDYASTEDAEWAIREAKDLLLEIDKASGVPVVRADWD